MIQTSSKKETQTTPTFSSDRLNSMRELAARVGARPIKPEIIDAVKCKQYYVGCNTIESKV